MTISSKACFANVVEGRLRGQCRNGIRRFKSIPYAAPPVAENRFQPPRPVTPWAGERDATVAGPTPPQHIPAVGGKAFMSAMAPGWVEGSDYLTLNLWRPDDDRESLPVLVYIHGGGFILGSKDLANTDGSAFARDGVIAITISYRLGLEGFLPIPGVPTNLGLRDQIAALTWVQRNIRSFGGDPDNVTVAGESAGSVSIGSLLASPITKGLFRRAILLSGPPVCRELDPFRKIVEYVAKVLKVSPDIDGFRTVSHRAALKAQMRVARALIDVRNSDGVDPAYGLTRFMPLVGDDVVPEPPQAAIAKGASAGVDLLICTCRDEFNGITVRLGAHRWMFPRLARVILGWFHAQAQQVLSAYELGQPKRSGGHVFSQAVTDLAFRWPLRVMAEKHRGTAHIVEFDWPSKAFGGRMGSPHGISVPFMFDTLAVAAQHDDVVGAAPPQAMADRFHGICTRFVKGEAPAWPAYTAESRQVYSLVRERAEHEPPMPAADFFAH